MNQLIEILQERPIILAILIFWPLFLWAAKIIVQKVLFKYEEKNINKKKLIIIG
jgi:hypothetical protein